MGKIKKGSLIGGRYEVLEVLGGKGKSGMGDVFVCLDGERDEKVVLKSFQEKFLTSKFVINSFKHEALAWIVLDHHPHIVRAKYVIKLDEKPYLALEYIPPNEEGKNTLEHYFEDELNLKQVLTWGIQLCRAMEYAVSKGVISHLDIKPSNIMIDQEGILQLCDFGLARIVNQKEVKPDEEDVEDWNVIVDKYRPDLTYIGVFEGKVFTGSEQWMAPERFQGQGDIRSDVFSFGVVMYQAVNEGDFPFSKLSVKPYVLSTKNQGEIIINEFYPVIEKCIQTKPEDRYRDFSEIRSELEDLYNRHYGELPESLTAKKKLEAFEFENKGISFLTLGLTDMAIRELWRAIEKRPENAETHNYLGLAYMDKGALDVALVSFKEALKLNPNLFEAHLNLGDLHRIKGSLEEAIRHYEKALDLDERSFNAHYKLAKALEESERLERAHELYLHLLKELMTKDHRHYKKIKKKRKSLKKILKRR